MHIQVFDTIDRRLNEYTEILRECCDIESPTSYKDGVDAVGEYFIKFARARGWQVTVHEESVSGNAVCITMNGQVDAPPICFSAHMDTVHPVGSFGNPPTKIEGNIIKGPGTCDCKGGIVGVLLAMTALEDAGYKKRPVKLILQSDEEVGSSTSEKRTVEFMARMAKGAVAFINCESIGAKENKMIVARKGIIRYKFDVFGVAVHSGRCYEGASAVSEAAHKIIELEKWKSTDGITCNCIITEGGVTPNTVAEKCTFLADIRYMTNEELEIVKKRVCEIAAHVYVEGCRTELSVKSYRTNMEMCERNINLAERINAAFKDCGLPELSLRTAKGGSDAADMSAYGIPTVDSLAIAGGYAHTSDEYAFISSLASSAKRFAAVALKLEN